MLPSLCWYTALGPPRASGPDGLPKGPSGPVAQFSNLLTPCSSTAVADRRMRSLCSSTPPSRTLHARPARLTSVPRRTVPLYPYVNVLFKITYWVRYCILPFCIHHRSHTHMRVCGKCDPKTGRNFDGALALWVHWGPSLVPGGLARVPARVGPRDPSDRDMFNVQAPQVRA